MMNRDQRQFGFERMELWQLALEAMEGAQGIAAELGRPHGALADQLRRASVSICANLAEGVGKDGDDQRRFFSIARGSTNETAALVEVAARLGRVSTERRAKLRAPLLSVAAILTTLTRRQCARP
jgi:four helix bundle protein